ncbi:MAG: amino acid adenylation domain-containing protein, partial [Phaeodactylibacter sp.]|nr:amino acid adenylation domain-containing protein [Phaeodactylibacter sp.]
AALAAQISGKARIKVAAIEPAEPQENYALSNAQRRLWVLGQMDEDQVAYNMPMVIQLKGKLHVEALQAAFNHLIARHESLRTNIITVNGVPRQVIHPVRKVEIHLPTWQEKGEKALSEYILSFARQPFNLADGALLRLELLQMQEGAHPEESGQALLLLNMHHIISDGWSMEILLRELSHLYDAYIEEEAHALPALRIQYKDYAAWQNALLEQSELMEDLRNYWFQKLAPIEEGFPILELPADYPRPAVQSYQGAILSTTLSPQLLDDLEALSRSSGTTLYITLTAIVKALLYRYSGQRDIIIGSLSAGRNHADLEHQIGFYVNTLALRDYIAEGTNFIEFLAQVKQTSVEAIGHELYPFDRLVEELDLIRDTSRAPLFDVLIAIQNEESPVLKFGGSRAALESVDWQVSKFDLSFGFTPTSKGLVVDIEYSTDLYKPERIHRMFEHLECLIQSLLANSNQPVEKLSILPKAEQSRLLQEFSFIAADYNLDKTIHQLFEEQVEKTPDNVAVVFEDKELSYRVLNERANALAHYLRDNYDIKGDEIVALQVDRSDWMMVALLGTMKSGAAYLPIAPDCPENRTAYMLRDSGSRLLLTDRSTCEAARVFEEQLPVIAVETVQHANTGNPSPLIDSRNLAYVIYTSGSTGRPKGVMVEHRGVVNMLYGQLERLEVTAEDRTLLFAPYTFDASVGELYLGISAGAMMVIASRETLLSTGAFLELMHRHHITIADVTPSYLAVLDEEALANVRMLITAGEAAISKDVKKYSSRLQYVNIYGPTETTVVAASFKMPASYEIGQNVPIGRPVPNMEILIVDEHLQLVPIGVPGEIVVSGVGLARGYLNNEALTKEKFVPHPFKEGERLYRTGDQGRWLDDGNIEFLGRVDHQLKIRGYRVEPGEIEEALMQHPAVQSCVVVGKDIEGRKELIAYLAAKEGEKTAIPALRNFLSETLPDYMVPAYFVELEALPLTSHDKVDREALPEPDLADMPTGTDYAAPRNDMERLLAQTWAEVLRRPRIGIHDNFFHIGGDSIKALQISGRLGAQGWAVSIKGLFTQPTIAQLASKVVAKKKNYPQEMLSGKAPLSAAQQWFFEHIQTDPFHFNQSFFLSSAKRLDAHLLRQSLEALARQHDVLRATYSKEEGLPVQTVGKGINISFQLVAIERGEQEDAVIACHTEKAQAGFNLEKGPLLKAVLFQKKSGDELLLTIHHLVVDGVSWRILIEDLTTAYSQLEAGETIRLAPKTAPFAWWAEKAHAHANSPACLAHLDYWEQQLARPVDTIIAGHPDRPNKVGVSASVQFQLDKKQTQFLLQQTHQAYHTEINDILLCALSRALQQVFGGRTYQITLEGHGRETLFDMDVSRAVGWFTSMFPVVLTYEEELGYHLLSTKENLHRIPNKGMDYALLRYLSEQSFSQKENSAISFNYLGAFSNGPADALLTFSGRDTGPSISPAINRDKELDVLGILLDGKLQISITYSHQRMEKAKMDALAEAFEKELLQLMAHCMEQKAGQLSPADFTACDLSLEQYYDFLSANQLLADEIEDIYTLSPMQEGMLFHKLLNPGSPAYFNQLVLHLSATALDIPHFQYCWRQILKAHPVLRTSFFSEGLPSPLQVVHKEAGLSFVNRDISNFSPGKQEQILTTYLATDRGKGFSLKEKSLLRVALFQTGIAQFRLVISGHHITIDGWSLAILLQDLQLMYQNNGHFLQLKPYSPYIAWLREQPESESEAFWKEYLEGYEETAGIPGMQRTTPSAPIEPGSELLVLSSEQTAALEQLAKSHQVSLNTIVQGVWAVILGVYNQKEEVVFGITTSG